ncbi:hypothetical protein GCM10027422_46970 [Hymenobacter arcticus]
MNNSTFFRVLVSWLVLVGLGSGHYPRAWAQKKASTSQLVASPQGTGNLTIGVPNPNPACPNTDVTFTARGECSSWSWDTGGGTWISQRDIPNASSTVTIRWATPGTYTVSVDTDCAGTSYAERTITVVDTTPRPITTDGPASQLTATSATICQGNSLNLVPPAGSSNWVWSGANVALVSSSGVATVQPVAEANTYSLTYRPSGSSCTSTSTFAVNVAAVPGKVEMLNNEVPGANWRFGPGSFTLAVKNPEPGYVYNWYDDPASKTSLHTGPDFTPSLTQSRSYYVTATACQETEYTAAGVVLRTIQLLVAGVVPAAPVRLVNGTPTVLQATSSLSGPFTWFLNGLEIKNQTGSQLSVTQAGRYTVRTQYPGDYYSSENVSQPVDLVEGLDSQTANGQALTYLSDLQVLKAGVTTVDQLPQLATADRVQNITYLTSWAQPLQQVAVQAGPAQQDIVQYYTYAGSATAAQTYLPFPVNSQAKAAGLYETDPLSKLTAYYAPQDSQPYATTTAEASPLGRPLSQVQAGSAWASHAARVSYATNTTQDAVRLWQGLTSPNTYAAGQLNKEVLLDADERRTEVYKDGLGRVVLQRKITGYGSGSAQNLDTYSIYAPAGYLQYVIPPAAVGALAAAGTWNVSSMPAGFAGQWLYQYTYDDRGRLAERQFPGAAPVYLVYDQADRPILVQDGNHRKTGVSQWLFTKFDAQNRPVVSGLYYSTASRQTLQAQADAATSSAEFESRTNGGYTTGNTFPAVQDGTNGAVVLSMSFFDDYDLNQDGSPDYAYASQVLGTDPQPVATTQLRGLPTITRTRVVQPGGQYGNWLQAVLFYDEYGNLIQKQSNNLLQTGSGLGDVTTLVYRQQGFVPQVLRSLKTQQTNGLTGSSSPLVSIRNRFSYDAAGRLLQTWQQHQWKNTWEPEVLVSSNGYTGLGELTQKKLHSRDAGATFLQKVDLAYNLHGQLLSINKSDPTINPENDLFGLELVREQSTITGNVPRYDGGISAVSWMAHNAAQQNQPERERRYKFTYDGLGRLTDATYAARNRPWELFTLEQGAYDEKEVNYDANGNIKALKRYTQVSAAASPMVLDDLTFTYTGNQHSKVDDAGDITRGFKDVNTSTEYDYDANGSITRDANKNVTYTFNSLNKVERQAVGTGALIYTYDAAGTVLKREVVANGTTSKTEYYIDGSVYQAAPGFVGLLSVPTSEGRALAPDAQATALSYEYHLRDHLGNLRVAFRADRQPELLHLAMEDPSREEGAYPKFQNVSASQSPNGLSYHGGTVARGSYSAAVSASQSGPLTRIPVVQGDQLKVSLYYATPNGVQYGETTPQTPGPQGPGQTGLTATPQWAVAPTLLAVNPAAGNRELQASGSAKPVMGVQVSVTGLLTRLLQKKSALPARSLANGSGSANARTTSDFDLEPGPEQPQAVAYVALRVYDQQNRLIQEWRQEAPVQNTGNSIMSWNQLRFLVTPDLSNLPSRAGYLEVQLLNEGSQPVYFDSLTIRHPQDRTLVSQENHYYPLGMALSGVAVNTVPVATLSKEQFNDGSTLQDELLGTEGGVYSTFYRTYDPATGRFTGVDPLANVTPDWTPYQFALGNPIAMNDPSGALSEFGSWGALIKSFFDGTADEGTYSLGGGGGGGSGNTDNALGFQALSYVDVANRIFYTLEQRIFQPVYSDNNGNYYHSDKNNFNYFVEIGHALPNTRSNDFCPTCLDPSSLHQNGFGLGLDYTGGNNPKSYNGNDNYEHRPESLADYPSIGHDRRYDNIGARGPHGVLFDTHATGADLRFGAEQYGTFVGAFYSGKFVDAYEALGAGTVIGVIGIAKGLYVIAGDPKNGLFELITWYKISNKGVTNDPSYRGH